MLVVEDELLVAMELDHVLRAQGCTVLGPAATVGQAVVLIGEGEPQAAVLDLDLDGQSSLPVAAVLEARRVPFLVVSGFSEKQLQSPELSRAPRLRKPVNHNQLLQTLRRVLSHGS